MHHREIHMVVTDLDGTLLSPDREISDKAIETIALLRKKEIYFTFITGRPPYAMERFARYAGITDPIACCNGAVIVRGEQLLAQHSFPLKPLRPLMERAAALGLTVLLYAQGIEYALTETDWTRSRQGSGKLFPLWKFTDHLDTDAVKVNIMVEDRQRDDFATLIPEVSALKNEFSVALYGQNGCEIVSAKVNKGTALAELCQLCGVSPEQTLAIGDNENDNPMLLAAGVGAAVSNAAPSTKSVSDYLCQHSCTDGVLEAIEKFVLGECRL